MNSTKGPMHPKQIIIEYYDSLINKIDIYIEELLDKFNDDDVMGELSESLAVAKNIAEKDIDKNNKDEENEDDDYDEMDDEEFNNIEDFDEDDEDREHDDENDAHDVRMYRVEELRNPYEFYHTYVRHSLLDLNVHKSMKKRDYLNGARSFLIEKMKKMRSETLEAYEANKDGYKFDKDSSIEEIKEKIFGRRFCFLLDTKEENGCGMDNSGIYRIDMEQQKKRLVTLCAIETDFYLNETHLDLIKTYYERVNEKFYKWDAKINRENYILNEKNLFIQCIVQNIRFGMGIHDYIPMVMFFTKDCLLTFERMDYSFSNIPSVDLTHPSTIDFSYLKSLTIKRQLSFDDYSDCKVNDLSGLRNLEYLEIKQMFINQSAFIGLEKLVKLVLDTCKIKKIDTKTFESQRNLQFLKIVDIDYNVRLDSLKNLQVLALLCVEDFNYIKSIPTKSLEVLHINTHVRFSFMTMPGIDKFFKRTNLSRLPQLIFNGSSLEFLDSEWFSGLTNVNRLCLSSNKLESIKVLKEVSLSNIIELDLSHNRLEKIEKDCFVGMKSLKRLDLSLNEFKKLKPNFFKGLENLETLLLRHIEKLVIEKDSFIGLSSLKILDLSYCNHWLRSKVSVLDPKALDHLHKLECLKLKGSKLDIKESMLPRLKQLKKIVLYRNDLIYFNFDKLTGFNFKVIG